MPTSPLQDVRVLDLTIARSGPTAVRQLSDWGASVIRVQAPSFSDGIIADSHSSDFINLHTNKRVMTLDLKSPRGIEVLKRLATDSDVLVENFRPAVKQRLGIGYSALAAVNPRLVYASISGYGQSGPYAGLGAVDQIIQGAGGLMDVTGSPEGMPTRAGVALADVAAGHLLAGGIVTALYERDRSGLGQWVSVSLLEAAISFLDFHAATWLMDGQEPQRVGNHHPLACPMGTFKAADGYVNIAASTNALWVKLCGVVGADDLSSDQDLRTAEGRLANRTRVNLALDHYFSKRPRCAWLEELNRAGIPCGPVNTVSEVFADPQVEHLGVTERIHHSGRGDVTVLRNPVTMSRSSRATLRAADDAAADTRAILAELGYSPGETEELRTSGVV